jgi:hypothetical protein
MPFGTYIKQFKCYPVIMMGGKERKDVDKGGKSNYFICYFQIKNVDSLKTKINYLKFKLFCHHQLWII